MKLSNKIITNKLNTCSIDELNDLACQISSFLIDSISKTGGHIGANLGTIELTIALHSIFDLDKDKLLFDVGHQGYTHKLLTGRKDLFASLNTIGGMSRFLTPLESMYDILDASHGGTAVSIGSGIAYANKMNKNNENVVVVLGDGSFVEGMTFEGLNYTIEKNLPMMIVINDNGMSIPPNIGAVNKILSSENSSRSFFEAMGYSFFYVQNGHDLKSCTNIFNEAKKEMENHPTIVHVKTIKGNGLAIAKNHPYKLHFSMPFDSQTGKGVSPVPIGKNYTQVVEKSLDSFISEDKNTFVITPSTPYASGLDSLLNKYPDNIIDVGMAEQQAAGMASGLAMSGKKVFLCYQSTFMQRAMDQIFHDICFMNLPVTIIAARSGFAGLDSPTHHAIYDLSYLRGLPNLDIFYAGNSYELETILRYRQDNAKSPMIILHPYEMIRRDEDKYFTENNILKSEVISSAADINIITTGNRMSTAIALQQELENRGKQIGIINIRWIKPLDLETILPILKSCQHLITLEENVKQGGMGSAISELLHDEDISTQLVRVAIESAYTQTGDKDYLSQLENIDMDSILILLQARGVI